MSRWTVAAATMTTLGVLAACSSSGQQASPSKSAAEQRQRTESFVGRAFDVVPGEVTRQQLISRGMAVCRDFDSGTTYAAELNKVSAATTDTPTVVGSSPVALGPVRGAKFIGYAVQAFCPDDHTDELSP